MAKEKQLFGGDWTEEKLTRVRKYLSAYTMIMKNRHFRFAYIDAFAGTGYRNLKEEENQSMLMFPELVEQESKRFLDGSARIALQVQPRFTKYIFIEKDETRFADLQTLKTDFPYLKDDIMLVNSEANMYIQELCKKNWEGRRAVLFLDPYGMQVPWETIKRIANTQAIDLWYLFPLGVAVNRLLKKDGNITESIKKKLDIVFGASDWYSSFYQSGTNLDLFGNKLSIEKIADYSLISDYFINRLKTAFSHVAENPLPLLNSKNNPLYLLCFAANNPRGGSTAVKIAQDILGRR